MPLLHIQTETKMRDWYIISRVDVVLRNIVLMDIMTDELMSKKIVENVFIFRAFSPLNTFHHISIKSHCLFHITDRYGDMKRRYSYHFYAYIIKSLRWIIRRHGSNIKI